MPNMKAPIRPPELPEAVANDFRKILAFASSAGKTLSGADALEVIRSICLERLHGDARATAIVRHAERVRELLEAGATFESSDRLALLDSLEGIRG